MKIPNGINPAHVASKDKTRYILNGVKVKDGLAYASNGRSLFVTICEMEYEDDKREAIIPTRIALKAFKKKTKNSILPILTLEPLGTDGYNKTRLLDKEMDVTITREIEGKFPNIHQVVPELENYKLAVSLNVNLLLEISKAFGEEVVNIYRNENIMDPMFITSKTQEAFAVLMPVRIHDEDSHLKNKAHNKFLEQKRSALEKNL